jgi:hypothetical protein
MRITSAARQQLIEWRLTGTQGGGGAVVVVVVAVVVKVVVAVALLHSLNSRASIVRSQHVTTRDSHRRCCQQVGPPCQMAPPPPPATSCGDFPEALNKSAKANVILVGDSISMPLGVSPGGCVAGLLPYLHITIVC